MLAKGVELRGFRRYPCLRVSHIHRVARQRSSEYIVEVVKKGILEIGADFMMPPEKPRVYGGSFIDAYSLGKAVSHSKLRWNGSVSVDRVRIKGFFCLCEQQLDGFI